MRPTTKNGGAADRGRKSPTAVAGSRSPVRHAPSSSQKSDNRYVKGIGSTALSSELKVTGRYWRYQGFPACDELPKQWEEKCLAEPAERRFWFKIKRAPDHIAVELIEDNPKPQIGIQPCSSFFNRGNFSGEACLVGLLRGDRKEQRQIAVGPGNPDADRNRPIFRPSVSPLPLSRAQR